MGIADVARIAAALLGLAACTYPPLPPPRCDPMGSYSALTPLLWSQPPPMLVSSVWLSDDELTIYFDDEAHLYSASRATSTGRFGPQMMLNNVNLPGGKVSHPAVSHDGHSLWFTFERSSDGYDLLYTATRDSATQDFINPVALTQPINVSFPADTGQPFVTADEELWFSSDRASPVSGVGGGFDIWHVPLVGAGSATPQFADEVSSKYEDWRPVLSPDGRTLFFSRSDEPKDDGVFGIWRAHRNAGEQFQSPAMVSELHGPVRSFASWMSPDGCRLYVSRTDTNGDLQGFVASQP